LQFEKAEQIHSVDIGNEGSAFVEVLVGNSTSACEQDFEVLLVSSFFMSPTESRSGTMLNRVRMFGLDKLAKATSSKKWDRVKLVCTQPYNKNLAYGLSFIRFNSTPDDDDKSASPSSPKITKLGQFMVKEEEDKANSLKPGSLFFSRAGRPQLSPSTAAIVSSPSDKPGASYAAATLQASGVASPSSSATPAAPKEKSATKAGSGLPSPKQATPGKRKYDFPKERQGTLPVKKESPAEGSETAGKKTSPLQVAPKKFKEPAVSPPAGKASMAQAGPWKKASVPGPPPEGAKKKKKKKQVAARKERLAPEAPAELQHLLEGTVFVLSGFQNPFRSELRDKALEMGAKYRSDWSADCTHLMYST
uniref:DNA repair protein XRCC1-like n=1 Tax=Pristiophorus japonicus TaxID=55135 RepID=UPI00398F32E4